MTSRHPTPHYMVHSCRLLLFYLPQLMVYRQRRTWDMHTLSLYRIRIITQSKLSFVLTMPPPLSTSSLWPAQCLGSPVLCASFIALTLPTPWYLNYEEQDRHQGLHLNIKSNKKGFIERLCKHKWWSSHLTFVVKTDKILPPLMSKQTLLITSVFNRPRSLENDYTHTNQLCLLK